MGENVCFPLFLYKSLSFQKGKGTTGFHLLFENLSLLQHLLIVSMLWVAGDGFAVTLLPLRSLN